MKLTDREQKIEVLLSWYVDALEGWQEGGRGSDELGLKLMGRVWNHPSYKELNRCLWMLREEEKRLYWHVSQNFQAWRRTVLACPRYPESCDQRNPMVDVSARHFDERGNVRLKHKHGGDHVFFVRKTVPWVNPRVRPEIVVAGIRWIGGRFEGEPFIPDELLAKEKAA